MDTPPEIIPITDFRRDAARVIGASVTADTPVFITQCGYVTAVVLSPERYKDLLRLAKPVTETNAWSERRREDHDGLLETRYGLIDAEAADFFEAEGYEMD